MNIKESDSWTKSRKIELMKNNFMLSRPKFKDRYLLRAVMGNYNTKINHLKDLINLLKK